MKSEVERLAAKSGRATAVIVVAVGLAVAAMFGLLYASTPPTVVTVDSQESVKQQ